MAEFQGLMTTIVACRRESISSLFAVVFARGRYSAECTEAVFERIRVGFNIVYRVYYTSSASLCTL